MKFRLKGGKRYYEVQVLTQSGRFGYVVLAPSREAAVMLATPKLAKRYKGETVERVRVYVLHEEGT